MVFSCFHLNSFKSYYLNIKTRVMSTIVNKTRYLAKGWRCSADRGEQAIND